MNLLFLTYNNYFNRIVKKVETLSEYIKAAGDNYDKKSAVDFDPADGVSTTQVVNWAASFTPDYMVCYNSDDTISSRWFIMEWRRIRGKQYQAVLRRDVIADHYDSILTAPCFIQKGTITDDSDPAIFNNEGIAVNQIKKSETLLTDPSGISWIVGYLAKNAGEIKGTVDWTHSTTAYITLASSISSWEYFTYRDNDFIGPLSNIKYMTSWQQGGGFIYRESYQTTITGNGGSSNKLLFAIKNYALRTDWWTDASATKTALANAYSKIGFSNFLTRLNTLTGAHTQDELTLLQNYSGKVVKDSDGKFYRITVKPTGTYTQDAASVDTSTELWAEMEAAAADCGKFLSDYSTADSESFKYSCTGQRYRVFIDQIEDIATAYDMASTRAVTDDANYDLFCIPYGAIDICDENGNKIMTTSKELGIATAVSIAKTGSEKLYDLQLLPYCPMQDNLATGTNTFTLNKDETNRYTYVVDEDDNKVGIILHCPHTNITFDIPMPIEVERPKTTTTTTTTKLKSATGRVITISASQLRLQFTETGTGNVSTVVVAGLTGNILKTAITKTGFTVNVVITGTSLVLSSLNPRVTYRFAQVITTTTYDNSLAFDKKVSNECDLYRLCSPNYCGQFEFSVAKNGDISKFNVDMTFKPYSPYIHVNPDFKGLYGYDANDSRGLICNGDFSFGSVADKWQDYEIQNKNYEIMFNRQIQKMDVDNSIARQEAGFQAVAGAVSGTVSGAAGGAMAGGVYGAIAGAVVGGVSSTVGGVMDYKNLEKRQQEERSYAIDQYNYKLQNIQALPYSLTKCSALTYNNKEFPFVELYSCTEQERDALKAKIKYDGMTIMRIDTLANWETDSEEFIQGQLIRLDDVAEDSHMAQEIYNEIAKGVYL